MIRGAMRLAIAIAIAVPGAAGAQTGDPAAAAELFRQGRAALLEKRYDVACPALAESERLDPKVGTLINLALCEDATDKLASALKHWEEALTLAHAAGDAREAYVVEQRDALRTRVPRVVVRLAGGAPEGTRVLLDGADVAATDLGTPLPVDPGVHVVLTRSAGREDKRVDVTASQGATQEVTGEPGELLPVTPPPTPTQTTPAPEPPRPTQLALPSPERPRATGSTQRWIGYVTGGVGVVGLGLGTAWGIQAINAKNDSRCQNGVCDPAGAQAQRDGLDAGNRSTIAFIAGGVLVAGGVVLWLVAPRASAKKPSAALTFAPAPGGALVGARGSF